MKQLKVGDRIRLEGVVSDMIAGEYTVFQIMLKGGSSVTNITQAEADQCEIIESAEPAEAQKWEPAVGEMYEFKSGEDSWVQRKFIGFTSQMHPVGESDTGWGYTYHAIRPIAKPVTAEDELDEILAGVTFQGNRLDTVQRIMSWKVRHTPKPLEVTDEEIEHFADKVSNYSYGTKSNIINTVRHFLAKQMGGRG